MFEVRGYREGYMIQYSRTRSTCMMTYCVQQTSATIHRPRLIHIPLTLLLPFIQTNQPRDVHGANGDACAHDHAGDCGNPCGGVPPPSYQSPYASHPYDSTIIMTKPRVFRAVGELLVAPTLLYAVALTATAAWRRCQMGRRQPCACARSCLQRP